MTFKEEKYKLMGVLEESKEKLLTLDAKCDGLLLSLRNLLDPMEDDCTKLNARLIRSQAIDLHEAIVAARKIKAKIAKIESELG